MSQVDSPTPPQDTVTESSAFQRAVVKNWKTTTIGIVSAFASFVAFSPQTFGGDNALLVQLCKFTTVGGLAGLGITAKDYNTTGGSKQQ